MRVSIRLKFSLFLAVLLILAVTLLSYVVLHGVERNQQAQIETYLAQHVNTVNLRVKQTYYTGTRLAPQTFMQQRGRGLAAELAGFTGLAVTLYDMLGSKVGSSIQQAAAAEPQQGGSPLTYALQNKIAYQSTGESLLYLAPLQGPDGQMGVVELSYSLASEQSFLKTLQQLFINTGIGVVIFSFIIGYLYFNRAVSGIARLKAAAAAIRQADYLPAPPLKRKDELGELAEGIYYMSREIEGSIAAKDEEQRKLELAVQKLQALEQQQKQYIGNISHEFKTPLTSIKAYVDLLNMYDDDPKLLFDAKVNIAKETQRLYEMVEKVLQLTALERYDFESQAERVEVAAGIREICGRMKGKAERFGITMTIDTQPGYIWVDRESLEHIVINLLDNAIKYNVPQGTIHVRTMTGGGVVRIEISDSGIGIPGEARDRIFEPFYTVNRDRSRQSGGTGLGLSLVHNLVEKHGGSITLLETEEEGTAFELSFPAIP
ncbi:sensor histidine kinase [Paenibacillus donghaensis]|uniref:Signal transduction histidine-protein kinase/phosphatase MprB n=1 Tax=Paenibacillus donghaensis TaxID=414771 RepID=A0A2Z2KH76_9BACL|nr:HAMP domain-containing sensor histidine kinase [Paenibacillus donghaensis]ASA25237.1 two-component sensor histidine kinase [Paenibacillus donghaensis]